MTDFVSPKLPDRPAVAGSLADSFAIPAVFEMPDSVGKFVGKDSGLAA
ncbi:hypothetical protein [Thiobacillus sp.]|nr:hypothetical protein [Thiobacillus sp.]